MSIPARSSPASLKALRQDLLECRQCPQVTPPVVTGLAVESRIFLVGQAPGPHEGRLGRPFAYTAGRTLFKWFASIGVDEETFRARVHMAAVLRCFPGKAPGGGDRVPARDEIERCGKWMEQEAQLQRPSLVIPVGALAIRQLLPVRRLVDIIGESRPVDFFGRQVDMLALPHPSGLSTWHRTEPGRSLLEQALEKLREHPVWTATFS